MPGLRATYERPVRGTGPLAPAHSARLMRLRTRDGEQLVRVRRSEAGGHVVESLDKSFSAVASSEERATALLLELLDEYPSPSRRAGGTSPVLRQT